MLVHLFNVKAPPPKALHAESVSTKSVKMAEKARKAVHNR